MLRDVFARAVLADSQLPSYVFAQGLFVVLAGFRERQHVDELESLRNVKR